MRGDKEPLPRHLSEQDVRDAADKANSLFDFCQLTRLPRPKGRRVAKTRGLADKIPNTADLALGGEIEPFSFFDTD